MYSVTNQEDLYSVNEHLYPINIY